MRAKPSSNWDVPPPGYESMAPEQYKIMMAPTRAAAAAGASSPSTSALAPQDPHALVASSSGSSSSQQTRQARRLYVGNLPLGYADTQIVDFFNETIQHYNLATMPGGPVVQAQLNAEKGFAFLEFRSLEEATQAVALDGIVFCGQALRVRRPKDYAPPAGTVDPPSIVQASRPDPAPRLLVSGFPQDLSAEQIQELLASFGQLVELTLLKDPATNLFNGHVHCTYLSGASAEQAILGLADLEIGPSRLHAARYVPPPPQMALPISLPTATRVLALLNMVQPEELEDDDEYQDILLDVREECEKHGRVSGVKIPRDGPGLGKIFVEFTSVLEAQRAAAALSGRKFANRTVGASFVPEDNYARDVFA